MCKVTFFSIIALSFAGNVMAQEAELPTEIAAEVEAEEAVVTEEVTLPFAESLDVPHEFNDFRFDTMAINLEKTVSPPGAYFAIDEMIQLNDVEKILLMINPASLSLSRPFWANFESAQPLACVANYGLQYNDVLHRHVAFMELRLGMNQPMLMNENSLDACYQALVDSIDTAIYGPLDFLVAAHPQINDGYELQEMIVLPEERVVEEADHVVIVPLEADIISE